MPRYSPYQLQWSSSDQAYVVLYEGKPMTPCIEPDVIEEESLVEQARLRGEYPMVRLRELQQRHEPIGDVRGQGLLVGVG